MDFIHPVHQCVAVNMQGSRCFYNITFIRQIHIQGMNISGIMQGIVCLERLDLRAADLLQMGRGQHIVQQIVQTKILHFYKKLLWIVFPCNTACPGEDRILIRKVQKALKLDEHSSKAKEADVVVSDDVLDEKK